LEKEVITFAATIVTSAFSPQVQPEQLHGIEINVCVQYTLADERATGSSVPLLTVFLKRDPSGTSI